MLIVSRALQGIGGAMMFPQILSIIRLSFEGDERTRALAWFGCVISAGAIVGQVVGGLIISANIGGLSWRPTFLVNVPVGIAVLVIAAVMLQADQQRTQTHLDLAGVGLISAALLLLFVPLIEGRDAGWPIWLLVAFPACFLISTAFFFWERGRANRGQTPLLNVALFRQRAFSVGLGITPRAPH
jgi:MFS family permease